MRGPRATQEMGRTLTTWELLRGMGLNQVAPWIVGFLFCLGLVASGGALSPPAACGDSGGFGDLICSCSPPVFHSLVSHLLGTHRCSGFPCAMAGPWVERGTSSRRAPWETNAHSDGLSLADLDELCWPGLWSASDVSHVPSDQINSGAQGLCFVTQTTLLEYRCFRSSAMFVFVTKGFVKERLLKHKFEEDRIIEASLSVHDPVLKQDTPRALTLVNCSDDPTDWVTISDPEVAVKVSQINRMGVFVEIRQSQAVPRDWETFSDVAKFDNYIKQILQTARCENTAIQYKSFQREGYLAKRLLIPTEMRDQIYARSGLHSIQVRPIRAWEDAPESGLELLPLDTKELLGDLAQTHHQRDGFLGMFQTGRTIYYRTSDATISDARKMWYPDQDRWTPDNIQVKAIHHWKISGFPTGTSAQEVAETLTSLGVAAVPTKQLHFRELCVVFAFSAKEPMHLKFQTNIGIIRLEKLEPQKRAVKQIKDASVIAPTPSFPAKGKGKGKTKIQTSPSSPISTIPSAPVTPSTSAPSSAPSSSMASRVAILEQRLDGVQKDIQVVRSEYHELKTSVHAIEKKQDKGFSDLMEAIGALKGLPSSASSTPVKSPASKKAKP